MGYYLLEHPPASPQYRSPRRAAISGCVVVHTSESGPGTAALNVANFIAHRSDPGSYHAICDDMLTVDMLPDDVEAFGALNGVNWWAWHICAATDASAWTLDPSWDRKCIANMGAAIRAFWTRQGRDPNSLGWITAADAFAGKPGLVCHGDLQPADRTDAWSKHPQRAQLDAALLAAIRGSAPVPVPAPQPPAQEDDDVRQFIYTDGSQTWWVTDGLTKRALAPEEPQLLVDLGLVKPERDAKGNIQPKYLTPAQVERIPNAA